MKTTLSKARFQKIFKKAKDKIFIIDDYIGIKTLEHLRSVKAKITIFSDNKGKHLTHQELIDFQKEYPNVTLSFKRTGDKIHDRYILINYKTNNEQVWHLSFHPCLIDKIRFALVLSGYR